MTSNLTEKIDQLTDQILKNKKRSNFIVDLIKHASEVGGKKRLLDYFFLIFYSIGKKNSAMCQVDKFAVSNFRLLFKRGKISAISESKRIGNV